MIKSSYKLCIACTENGGPGGRVYSLYSDDRDGRRIF